MDVGATPPTPVHRVMSPTQRHRFELRLLSERARVERLLNRFVPTTVGGEEYGRFGDDLASRAAAGISRDDDSVVEAHAQRELAAIDAALRLLYDEPEKYGVCIVCGRAITLGRLDLLPTTRFCQHHARD